MDLICWSSKTSKCCAAGDELHRESSPELRGPFLESPGNLTGPKPNFEIKLSRKIGVFFTSNEAHFVSLANNFNV